MEKLQSPVPWLASAVGQAARAEACIESKPFIEAPWESMLDPFSGGDRARDPGIDSDLRSARMFPSTYGFAACLTVLYRPQVGCTALGSM
jgi:hypothetical protein